MAISNISPKQASYFKQLGARTTNEVKEIAKEISTKNLTDNITTALDKKTAQTLQNLYAKHAALPVDSPARKAAEKEIQKILKTLNKS